jgi:hypothetical protein
MHGRSLALKGLVAKVAPHCSMPKSALGLTSCQPEAYALRVRVTGATLGCNERA